MSIYGTCFIDTQKNMAFFVFRSKNRIEIKGWQQKIINLQYTPKFRYYLFHHKTKTNCPQKPIFAQNGENIVRLYVSNLQLNQMRSFVFMGKTIFLVKKGGSYWLEIKIFW